MGKKVIKTSDGDKLKDTRTGKLAGSVPKRPLAPTASKVSKSSKDKKNKKGKKNKNQVEAVSNPQESPVNTGTDFYAKRREQFGYFNDTNPPLNPAFAIESSVIKAEAIKGLRETFPEVEIALEEELEEYKALVVNEGDFWKVTVGLTEMLLDHEGEYRDYMVDRELRDYHGLEEGSKPESHPIYHDFILQTAKDKRAILQEKQRLLSIISEEVGIDDAFREAMVAITVKTPYEIHDAVFILDDITESIYYDKNNPPKQTVYKEGFEFNPLAQS